MFARNGKIFRNSGQSGRPTVGDGQVVSPVDGLESLIQQDFKQRIVVPDQEPVEFGSELGKALGEVGVEDVAVKPSTGGEGCRDLVIGQDGVVGTDLANPGPDRLG